MPRRLTRTIRFDPKKSRMHEGIALVYDLEGFSRFFNQPDVQHYVPDFLNHLSEAILQIFAGGDDLDWTGENLDSLPHPVHEKFLGDGALYVWVPPGTETTFDDIFPIYLCNRLFNFKNSFDQVIQGAADKVPVVDLPRRIRFGLARGTVYQLTNQGTNRDEYIGFCLNLASRLQKYCPDLGFIASARMRITQAKLQEHGYTKVVATRLRGFPNEIVVVDKNELDGLPEEVRNDLFTDLNLA